MTKAIQILNYFEFQNLAISVSDIKASFGRREWNGMEWKEMKIIILEYSSLPLFWSFNEGNGKPIPLFGSLCERKWN